MEMQIGEKPLPGRCQLRERSPRAFFTFLTMQIPMADKAHLMIDYPYYLALEHGAFILRGFALRYGEELQRGVAELQKSPLNRHSVTPSGLSMTGDSTTCFHLGWTTIERSKDHFPTDVPRAAMPEVLRSLGRDAAAAVGFNNFAPDVSLDSHASQGARLFASGDELARRRRAYRCICIGNGQRISLQGARVFGRCSQDQPLARGRHRVGTGRHRLSQLHFRRQPPAAFDSGPDEGKWELR